MAVGYIKLPLGLEGLKKSVRILSGVHFPLLLIRPDCVGFVVDKVAHGQGFLRVFGFSLLSLLQ